MAAPTITVHLRAVDGATFDLTIPAPIVTPGVQVRVADLRAYAVQTVQQWDGSKWVAG